MTVGESLREMVKAYEDDGTFVGIMTREAAKEWNYLTRTTQVIVHQTTDGQKKYLLTLRSPGCHGRFVGFWQIGYTETIDADEEDIDAAARGAQEELEINHGAARHALQHLFDVKHRSPNDPTDKKDAAVFDLDYNGILKPNPSEISIIAEVDFSRLELITRIGCFNGKPITPLSIHVWEKYKAEVKQ